MKTWVHEILKRVHEILELEHRPSTRRCDFALGAIVEETLPGVALMHLLAGPRLPHSDRPTAGSIYRWLRDLQFMPPHYSYVPDDATQSIPLHSHQCTPCEMNSIP